MIEIYNPTIMGVLAGSVGLLGYFVRRQVAKVDNLQETKANRKEVRELLDTKLEVLRVQDAELKEDVKEIKSDIKEIKKHVERIWSS